LLLVYRPHLFKNVRRTILEWRKLAKRYGLGELYLCVFTLVQNRNSDQMAYFGMAG